ncbi:hypothetical protein LTR37_011119 [Vermiconidia calcicola]|uniref:Uncharacterized protein n=1 Tax=Vermiconidia calcicola TaxID=1690605 RepID=A0ACC3N4E7_9PEZI|nr:hypothetical protein LTR37_011119 [Vermiconidia calcicola]
MSKPANTALQERGVELRALDLKGSQETIVSALKDIGTVISAIGPMEQLEQIPLATAAKTAGVEKFLPCGAMPVVPVGIHVMRDLKEQVYNHVKRLRLPYTIVDVGWWYQLSFPELPSGKIDYAIAFKGHRIPGDGNMPTALTNLRDIGPYIARIIQDDRTLNRMVLVYNEMWTWNQIYDTLEKLSGEKLPRERDSLADLEERLAYAEEKLKKDPNDMLPAFVKIATQYVISWDIRGDNTPENAKYLGYLTSKELYPGMGFIKFRDYLQEVLDGKAKPVNPEMKDVREALFKAQRTEY